MIEVNNICKSYHEKHILKELTCTFEKGHVYSIIAPNGTGKTTFISILSGLLIPDTGTVNYTEDHSVKDTYIVLSGEKNLYAKNTVKENACYVGRLKGKTSSEIRTKTDYLRERFPVYNEVFNSLAEKLSFGQKRLVALLNSAVANSSCIIIDEVSEGLDITHTAMILEMIDFLKEGRIIILASHDYEFVSSISDHNWFLKDGDFQRKYGCLSKEQLIMNYKELYLHDRTEKKT